MAPTPSINPPVANPAANLAANPTVSSALELRLILVDASSVLYRPLLALLRWEALLGIL